MLFSFLFVLLFTLQHGVDSKHVNVYSNRPFYKPAEFSSNLKRTEADASKKERATIQRMKSAGSALWLDKMKRTEERPDDRGTLAGALKDAASQNPVPVVTFVVYNLPNRDCDAGASLGELCCARKPDGSCDFLANKCTAGLQMYRSYINRIERTMKQYCHRVPMSVVIEPDSLPNLVTNLGNTKCGSGGTKESYRKGIKFAVEKLSAACNKASLYVDAAHGRWLGWDVNTDGFIKEIKALKITDKIRGFSTNVANYNPVGQKCPNVGTCRESASGKHPCCRTDPCKMASQYNAGHTEINYVQQLRARFKMAIPRFSPHFIIDTARASTRNNLAFCQTWCNPRDMGLGPLPTTRTGDPSAVDAYVWIKIPGESDGCTQTLPNGKMCPRFDFSCGSSSSIGSKNGEPRAPEAGDWFNFQVRQLTKNAAL